MLKKLGFGLLLSAALTSQAMASCVLEQAMYNIEYGYIQLRADHARQSKPILDEMQKLTPKNGNNDLPVGLQMSPQASRRYEKLSFDLLKIRARTLILSAYQRDARVIAKAAQVAENTRNGREYGETDPDYFYAGVLALVTVANEGPDSPNPQPSADDCSLDSGLWVGEKLVLDHLDGAKTTAAWVRMQAAARQFKINMQQQGWFDQLDHIPLLPARKQAQIDRQVVLTGVKDLNYVKAIEALRALNNVSMTIYSTHRADISASTKDKDDFDKRFGSTWEAQVNASDEKAKRLEGIIRIVQEKVPSDTAIENQQMLDALKKIGEAP